MNKLILEVAPKPWTHYHVNRLMHVSRFAAFSFIILTLVVGLISNFFQAWAQEAEGVVNITAIVPDIQPGQTVVVNSGSSSGTTSSPETETVLPLERRTEEEKNEEIVQKKLSEENRTLERPDVVIVKTNGKQELVNIGGKNESRMVFTTQTPTLAGKTNIKGAIIFIEIHSPQVIRATTQADKEGNWSWTSPEFLTEGPHAVTITAQDKNFLEIRSVITLDILIRSKAPVKQIADNGLYQENPDKTGNLFDIFVSVPQQFKIIAPGDQLAARIKLVNFGSVGNPIDVIIDYTITDSDNNVIVKDTDTVAVATHISLLKTFNTSPTSREGLYKITARVPSKDIIAVATESFELKGAGIIKLSDAARLDLTIVYQTLLILLFFFCLVAYFEYNKIGQVTGFLKQINEKDLKSEA